MVRYKIIAQTLTVPSRLRTADAARMLRLSIRQVFRLKSRVKSQGQDGLVHGNRGRRPAITKSRRLLRRVLHLYAKTYGELDLNFAHFTDLLLEKHGVQLSPETVRRWLRAAGLGPKVKRCRRHRRARVRRPREGQLLFLDGSPHRWLGPQGPKLTLILASDDATGKPLYGQFQPQETRDGCFQVFYQVAQCFGLPQALYLDRAGHFTTTRHGGVHCVQSDDQLTAFEIAMRKLGVELIFANSPQARGRGERLNGSFQRRLVAELRYEGIKTAEAATAYLNQQFIPRYRRRFAVAPKDLTSAFRPVPEGLDLHRVLCVETTRIVAGDNTISLHGRKYQLLPPATCPSLYAARVTVQEWFDQTVHVYHQLAGEIPVQLLTQPKRYYCITRSG